MKPGTTKQPYFTGFYAFVQRNLEESFGLTKSGTNGKTCTNLYQNSRYKLGSFRPLFSAPQIVSLSESEGGSCRARFFVETCEANSEALGSGASFFLLQFLLTRRRQGRLVWTLRTVLRHALKCFQTGKHAGAHPDGFESPRGGPST